MDILVIGILVVVVTALILFYFRDMIIVFCPNCKSINSSSLIFSSDSIKNHLDSQKGFKRARQMYYVTERFSCKKCGKEFERIARKRDTMGMM